MVCHRTTSTAWPIRPRMQLQPEARYDSHTRPTRRWGRGGHLDDEGLRMWSHSQDIYFLRDAVVQAFGIDPETVRIEHVPGAGCYGHNSADDAAFDAAIVARALSGAPVLLDARGRTRLGTYATATSMKYQPASIPMVRSSTGTTNHADTFNMRPRSRREHVGCCAAAVSRAAATAAIHPQPAMFRHMGILGSRPLYVFPQKRLVKNLVRDLPLRTSALRTLGAFGNVFALGSFMDELANAAGIDPVTFRLNHLEDARGREVLAGVAARMDLPRTTALVRVSLCPVQELKSIRRRRCRTRSYRCGGSQLRRDSGGRRGEIVDRDGMAAQYDGGFLQAASWTIHEQVTWATASPAATGKPIRFLDSTTCRKSKRY